MSDFDRAARRVPARQVLKLVEHAAAEVVEAERRRTAAIRFAHEVSVGDIASAAGLDEETVRRIVERRRPEPESS